MAFTRPPWTSCYKSPVIKHVPILVANETAVWIPTVGTRFVLTDLTISSSVDNIITIRDGVAGTTRWVIPLLAKTPFHIPLQTPFSSATIDNALTAQGTAGGYWITALGYES